MVSHDGRRTVKRRPWSLPYLGQAVTVAALLATLLPAEGSRILAVFPVATRSHHITLGAVTRALADAGHDVTYCSGLGAAAGRGIHPDNNRIVHLSGRHEQLNAMLNAWGVRKSPLELMSGLLEWGFQLVNTTLSDPLFRAELDGQRYDLILTEAFLFQEGFVALGHHFDAPVVAVNPFGTVQPLDDVMGNAANPAWAPSPFLGFADIMSLRERLVNTVVYGGSILVNEFFHIPRQQALVQTYWPDAPPLQDLLQTRLALSLVNSHFSLGFPVPLAPSVVEIGGIHLSEMAQPLPEELQHFLDSAERGVVYFSMGSILRLELAPPDKLQAIVDALAALEERVVVKWDGPAPRGLPANVRLEEWVPQADLLGHPNVRAFVSHGGLGAVTEAAYRGVPIVGVPMFGDHRFNMRMAERHGFGVAVDFATLSSDTLGDALRRVLRDPKYKRAAERASRLTRSRLMRPAEAAVWAVEHVLQHGGDHLRPACVGMPLYRLLLLDVVLALILAMFMAWLSLRLCWRALVVISGALNISPAAARV